MSAKSIRDLVKVRGRFHRSVQLARDARDPHTLDEYVLTPTARDLAQQILASLTLPSGERAWSITGPYGTGKSAFALFLAELLTQAAPVHSDARRLRREAAFHLRPLVPILIVGQRASFTSTFLSALGQSLKSIAPSLAQKISKAATAESLSDSDAVSWLEQAAAAAQATKRGGLLIVVDEFGKFLEYAALHPETEDLFVLQHLAETAARSPIPILLITILHTSFAEYVQTADQAQRVEWQKVQGRFVDVAFQEPPEQLLRLVGAAIERRLPPKLEGAYRQTTERILRSDAWHEARQRFPNKSLLLDCLPLHPITALLLWPVFRSKLAQNERSLFAFLTGQEPFGFQEFLILASLAEQQPAFFRIDQLYDYVVTALGAAIYIGDRAHRWAEIGHALDRVATDAPLLASAVVKAVGLLGVYGSTVGLRAAPDLLALALNDHREVDEALAYLVRSSILVYRQHEKAYGLWEGSDVDLEVSVEEARRHVGQGDLATRLKQTVTLRPLVARAHYIQTGTLRYFSVDIIPGTEPALREALARPVAPADGQIIYVLTPSVRDRQPLIELSKILSAALDGADRQLRLFAFPKPMTGLEEAVQEVESWRWIAENMGELQGDPVARREVRARTLHARQRLENIAGSTLGLQGQAFDPNASEWVQGGKIHSPESAREFLQWLSALCAKVFSAAPNLRNELLNRERLSSAAAAARRNLLEAMLTREAVESLGFSGTPPEASMYRSLLLDGGFHQRQANRWQFGEPGKAWQPVWQEIHQFLETTHTSRRPLLDLFAVLRRAPFGLREGPLPLVLCTVLLAHRDDVTLYESGVFVHELRIEVFERLQRVPQTFEIQQYVFARQDWKAFEAVGSVLRTLQLARADAVGDSPILRLVKPLVVFAARLPAYTKNTKRIEPHEGVAVREALLRARDPYALMHNDLPTAMGLQSQADTWSQFPQRLKECLLGLQRAYPRLLDEIEVQLRDIFDLHGTAEEARRKLQLRSAPLEGQAAERTLALFVREASRLNAAQDWRETLGRVVNGGLPPNQWHDHDLVNFQVRLRQLASDFVRLEELVAEQRRTGATEILRIGLLNGRSWEAREVVSVTPERAEAVDMLTTQITEVLETHADKGDEARRVRLAALARVAAHYLHRNESGHDE